MSAKKESPLAKGIEMMTIRTNRSLGRIIIALVSRLKYAILEYSRQIEPMAESPRSIDFDPTDFILLLGFGTFIFFYFSCPFLLPHFPMSFFTTYEYENIYQEFDHLLSIIIEGIREREGKAKAEKKREMLRIFLLI
jgi:hypothetical protein